MPHISKQIVREIIETLDVCGVGAHHPDLLELLDQPEGEPVACKKLVWSEHTKPNSDSSYDHVKTETPLGDFYITWKSWKDYPQFALEIVDQYIVLDANTLEDAKIEAQEKCDQIFSFFTHQPAPQACTHRITDATSEELFTHAQPLQPITAEDVTDEMIDELARRCPTMNSVEVDRQTIAASFNIYNTYLAGEAT